MNEEFEIRKKIAIEACLFGARMQKNIGIEKDLSKEFVETMFSWAKSILKENSESEFNKSIENLKLSKRTLNSLKNSNIITIDDLISEEYLCGIEGIGEKAVKEIKTKLWDKHKKVLK